MPSNVGVHDWDELEPVFKERFKTAKYISVVYWPKDSGLCLGNTMRASADHHHSLEMAQAVCNGLQKGGFGMEGKIFPIATRVYVNPKFAKAK